ncbi:sulfotransferase [Pseudoxanthomonas sp. J35]|uniref:tetratricopeptide repeat-containing sulfotransferase family protein n=1 Tax=Pseudoxanthomonas sp. J35 TaxID=935852 RepID=UPI0004B22196|nr:sulfotransferase [Pseudoxanthomonas sp. J35]
MQVQSIEAWRRAEAAARNGAAAARAAFAGLLARPELELPARLRLSALDLGQGALRDATAQVLAAARLPESDPGLLLELARRLFDLGEVEAGLECLRRPVVAASREPGVHAAAGRMLSDLSFYDLALERLEHAHRLGLRDLRLDYAIGLARMYCGALEPAEEALEQCLRADPDYLPALRLLSTLRRQTPERNHVDRLRASLARLGEGHAFAPLAHYALFKELDDLGDTAAAWQHLEQGMRTRRVQLAYDEQAEVELFRVLQQLPFGDVPAAAPEPGTPAPVFVVGMPRSGTTLLERMLAAHPAVADAGELRDFTCQLRWCTDRLGGPHPDAALARAAAGLDPRLLGARYLEHTAWRAHGRDRYIDKLPANFLVAGLIAAALPQARIVHMARDPMDSCFSNLKALFADAYPHSYSQAEMARHYLRYRALMAHWDRRFPGRILEVRYEALVADPEAEARRVLAFCGLQWCDEVLGEGGRKGMVGTASTVQVREPIHRRYLGQWRRYAAKLMPMKAILDAPETE